MSNNRRSFCEKCFDFSQAFHCATQTHPVRHWRLIRCHLHRSQSLFHFQRLHTLPTKTTQSRHFVASLRLIPTNYERDLKILKASLCFWTTEVNFKAPLNRRTQIFLVFSFLLKMNFESNDLPSSNSRFPWLVMPKQRPSTLPDQQRSFPRPWTKVMKVFTLEESPRWAGRVSMAGAWSRLLRAPAISLH